MWEILLGGRLEGRYISDTKYDKAQRTWSYLVKKEAGAEELGWLGEASLTSDGPSVDTGGC